MSLLAFILPENSTYILYAFRGSLRRQQKLENANEIIEKVREITREEYGIDSIDAIWDGDNLITNNDVHTLKIVTANGTIQEEFTDEDIADYHHISNDVDRKLRYMMRTLTY